MSSLKYCLVGRLTVQAGFGEEGALSSSSTDVGPAPAVAMIDAVVVTGIWL